VINERAPTRTADFVLISQARLNLKKPAFLENVTHFTTSSTNCKNRHSMALFHFSSGALFLGELRYSRNGRNRKMVEYRLTPSPVSPKGLHAPSDKLKRAKR
jgi:hypothetical protein